MAKVVPEVPNWLSRRAHRGPCQVDPTNRSDPLSVPLDCGSARWAGRRMGAGHVSLAGAGVVSAADHPASHSRRRLPMAPAPNSCRRLAAGCRVPCVERRTGHLNLPVDGQSAANIGHSLPGRFASLGVDLLCSDQHRHSLRHGPGPDTWSELRIMAPMMKRSMQLVIFPISDAPQRA